ncbi:hypothetical protein GQR58_026051 [Nymphon striatum]|nr:hypothetical protein GQR58_026051 [Nymphon striatum]
MEALSKFGQPLNDSWRNWFEEISESRLSEDVFLWSDISNSDRGNSFEQTPQKGSIEHLDRKHSCVPNVRKRKGSNFRKIISSAGEQYTKVSRLRASFMSTADFEKFFETIQSPEVNDCCLRWTNPNLEENDSFNSDTDEQLIPPVAFSSPQFLKQVFTSIKNERKNLLALYLFVVMLWHGPRPKVEQEITDDGDREESERLMNLTQRYDEVIVVFDTYKPDSLKETMRQKRRQGKDPVQYQVHDDTNIKHLTMSRFLSHDKTKAALTEYLAEKILDYSRDSPKLVITSASGRTHSNNDTDHFEDNNHEEADTLMICLAITSMRRNRELQDIQMTFFSPETDVLVLVIANYDLLPRNTSICMASGKVHIQPLCTHGGLWNTTNNHKSCKDIMRTQNLGYCHRMAKQTPLRYLMVYSKQLQGDTLAPLLFILALDYAMRKATSNPDQTGFTLHPRRSRRYPKVIITDADFADGIALLSDTIERLEAVSFLAEGSASPLELQSMIKPTPGIFDHDMTVEELSSSTEERIALVERDTEFFDEDGGASIDGANATTVENSDGAELAANVLGSAQGDRKKSAGVEVGIAKDQVLDSALHDGIKIYVVDTTNKSVRLSYDYLEHIRKVNFESSIFFLNIAGVVE